VDKVLGTHRKSLVDARASVQVRVKAQIIQTERLIRLLDRYPEDATIEDALRDALSELKHYTVPTQAYAAMCRETIKKKTAMLDVKLPPFD
jgi:hypothetical protein